MRVERKNKAFAYRVPIGDYNYLQCTLPHNLCIMTLLRTLVVLLSKNILKSNKKLNSHAEGH